MSNEIFSFHLMKLPFLEGTRHLISGVPAAPGLRHAEMFYTMNLDEPILGPSRYNLRSFGVFSWWESDEALSSFRWPFSSSDWHVRMKLYRRWGSVAELSAAVVDSSLSAGSRPMVAVTLAHLRLSQTARFIKYGRPVERQVRNHKGQLLALAAIRPLGTFSTFSLWQNEAEMLGMVHGGSATEESHRVAMRERARKDFHHEFTTMRFVPYHEEGTWNGRANYLGLT